jgi:3-oxoacyl-[acyl-carrier-protein] synthase II
MMERVVVTGLGLVTPLGIGAGPTFEALLAGHSGAGPITLFDAHDGFSTRFAAEVKGFDANAFISKKKQKEISRFIGFSLAATRMALQHAELQLSEEERDRTGCFIGVGFGGIEQLERLAQTVNEKGPGRASPYFIPSIIANLAAGQVTMEFGLRGPSYCHTSACTSSAHAIGEAYEWIRAGRADVMVCGGAEATITSTAVAGFNAMFALSRRNQDPARASRPFDRERDGFVMGEGAGTLVLEKLSRAKARGANILAEVSGWGATSDAFHVTKPAHGHPQAARAMQLALQSARLNPEQVGYVNAHGTSTPTGDLEESLALESVFGPYARDGLWVSSTKSMMGHLLGAAGAVEAAVCVNAVSQGHIPPTINYEHPDPECRLDYVPNVARTRDVRHALSNSFGFGGTNAVLAISRFND